MVAPDAAVDVPQRVVVVLHNSNGYGGPGKARLVAHAPRPRALHRSSSRRGELAQAAPGFRPPRPHAAPQAHVAPGLGGLVGKRTMKWTVGVYLRIRPPREGRTPLGYRVVEDEREAGPQRIQLYAPSDPFPDHPAERRPLHEFRYNEVRRGG